MRLDQGNLTEDPPSEKDSPTPMILPPQNKTTKLGRQVLVQPVDQRRCQIVQLLSNDPSDFLVTAMSPGNIIAFP